MGQNDKREEYLQKGLEIRKKLLGANHADFANSFNSLGVLYSSTAQYYKCEVYLENSLHLRNKIFGPEHVDVAMSLNNLDWLK